MKILTILGARPQFIKAAAVSRIFAKDSFFQEVLINTGQHYDYNMSGIFFEEMSIPKPKYPLQIGSASHGAQTGRMMEKIEEIALSEKPDVLLVYGDTNSTLAGALVAAKLHIPVAHVEAGLRSFNRKMPEEVNRVLTDHAAEWLFCPTQVAVNNLKKEGLEGTKVHHVGDVMLDAALFYSEKSKSAKSLDSLKLRGRDYVLATIHRAENTDNKERLWNIMASLARLAESHPVVLPLHPRTRNILKDRGDLQKFVQQLTIIDPVGYFEMIQLEKNAALIATDSGGIQKEAYFYGVPCVTLRSETECVELLASGWNRLADPALGVETLNDLYKKALGSKGSAEKFYGEGHASEAIAKVLKGV